MTAAVPKYWQSRADSNRRSGSQNPVPYPLATALYDKRFPERKFRLSATLHRKAPALASHLCYSLLAGLIPHPRRPCARQGCLMLSPLYIASFGLWCGDGGCDPQSLCALPIAAPWLPSWAPHIAPSLPGCQGGFHTSTSFNVSLFSRRTYDSATSVFVLYSMVQPLEPPTGLEPALSAWKAEVLPLHHGGIS